MLYDNHGRVINYMRIAVTDRCNLRCHYCMPEKGIRYVDRRELLTFEEMERIARIGAAMGIDKIRITGGEPFVRRGMIDFLSRLTKIEGIKNIHITTNGTMTAKLIPQLEKLGVKGVNLSLDSLNRSRFHKITRQDSFDQVMKSLNQLLTSKMTTKINMVVMSRYNIDDIIPMIELTENHHISVRFLEEMPFNGSGRQDYEIWNHVMILDYIKKHYKLEKLVDDPHSTSSNYRVVGHSGTVGIIASYSRIFCGSCNRIRLTPVGTLKTCLYDDGVFNIRDLIRSGATDKQIAIALTESLSHRAKDGIEAEARRHHFIAESMATIGG